jgi:Rha family phage regulatory protein
MNTATVTNSLVMLLDDKAMTTSLKVAEMFGKAHRHILRDIERLIERGVPNFEQTSYVHPQNRQEYRMFLMDRDGFSLLVMGFTGNKALAWKLKYIEAFNRMEAELMKRQVNVLPDFTNLVEAARAWADQVEQKMVCEAQAKALVP